ncbi:MAG: Asp23/Gls24 family envelope stress response protein [Clostridia bacterium]|nr:Asp23/Gls24 family envelope stress response protein [Clostridia bacterium]
MARFKKIPHNIHEGKLIYNTSIIDGIVLLAVQEIPYVELYAVAPRNKMYSSAITVSGDKDGVHIDVSIKIHYSQSVSDTAFKIQEAIRHNVEAMTEYHIASVNVLVCGIMFDDKAEEKMSTIVAEN